MMSRTIALARREMASYFCTPVGYVVIALFLLVSGFLFSVDVLSPGRPATMRPFFETTAFMLIFLAPAISMRLLAEELRIGTIEGLMTCPVNDVEVVIGKWVGAMLFFVAMLVPTFLFVVILEIYAAPDYGAIVCGYLGLLLVGGVYLAVGLVASSLWGSQILAYLMALFFWLIFWGVTTVLPANLPDPWSDMLFWMSVTRRFSTDFAKGVIDAGSAVYLLSGIILFLVIATKVIESRRWR
ncbi:MAG: hypothetical protein D8M59_15360 [Planctomycetes bacterium]|nr:hypothetical protein [Planctomycetota bacterium]NOG55346.1 ABC transporter permease subunit [Planctomycetota bacterium]